MKEQLVDELTRTRPACESDSKYFVSSTMRIERYYSSVKEDLTSFTPYAQKVLSKQDYVGFFKTCGPNYIRSIRRAQEVTAIFSYFAGTKVLAQEYASLLKANKRAKKVEEGVLTKNKFKKINKTLEIKVLGYGLGLDYMGAGSLVVRSVTEYNDIVNFAFKTMTDTKDASDVVGMVYSIEVMPWVDNVQFQVASKMLEEIIKIPLPRSLISKAVRKDRTISAFDKTLVAEFECKDPIQNIDMYGYCCETDDLYDAANRVYEPTTPIDRICRPVRDLEKSLVANNMASNAEFVASLAASVQHKFNQIGTLESCVSAAQRIPEKYDYNFLRPQRSVTFDASMQSNVTLVKLKRALDPLGDYGLVNHLGKELDEYMDMYYIPCLGALFGKNIHGTTNFESGYFMAYPWHTHDECKKLTCLHDNMRWDRDKGGCVEGLLAGPNEAAAYNGQDSACSHDVEGVEIEEACKYNETTFVSYYGDVTNCWNEIIPEQRVDVLISQFCMPVVAIKKESEPIITSIKAKILSSCTVS